MRLNFWRRGTPGAGYMALRTSPPDDSSPCSSTAIVIPLSLTLVLVSGLSFLAGQRFPPQQGPARLLELEYRTQIFTPEDIFPDRPNITTDKAWLDLFPTQGGFFKHPKLAPDRSTFAVFHQLHCLDGIRHAYWTLLDRVLENEETKISELPHHAAPNHVRHCVDLLRQALMCQPDLTIEIQNDELGGVTGFGTEHICVDWRRLVDWTSEWENYDQHPPPERVPDIDPLHPNPTHLHHDFRKI